jgi:hypothetical protein
MVTVFEKIWSAELTRTTTILLRSYKTPIKMSSASVCHLDAKTYRTPPCGRRDIVHD